MITKFKNTLQLLVCAVLAIQLTGCIFWIVTVMAIHGIMSMTKSMIRVLIYTCMDSNWNNISHCNLPACGQAGLLSYKD